MSGFNALTYIITSITPRPKGSDETSDNVGLKLQNRCYSK